MKHLYYTIPEVGRPEGQTPIGYAKGEGINVQYALCDDKRLPSWEGLNMHTFGILDLKPGTEVCPQCITKHEAFGLTCRNAALRLEAMDHLTYTQRHDLLSARRLADDNQDHDMAITCEMILEGAREPHPKTMARVRRYHQGPPENIS